MFGLLLFATPAKCLNFGLEHLIITYTNMISKSMLTCILCILLSLLLIYKGSQLKVICMTIILAFIFTLFYEDLATWLLNKANGNMQDEGVNKQSILRKIYGFFLKGINFFHTNSYITIGIFMTISYFVTSTIDISLFIYIAYLCTTIFDGFKSIYLDNIGTGVSYVITAIIIIVAYRLTSYLKAILYSLFYSIVGSTSLLIGIEVLFNKNWGYSEMYGAFMRYSDFSEYKYCLILQLMVIGLSVFLQVKDVYLNK